MRDALLIGTERVEPFQTFHENLRDKRSISSLRPPLQAHAISKTCPHIKHASVNKKGVVPHYGRPPLWTVPVKGKDLNLLKDILFVDIKGTEPPGVTPDVQPKSGEGSKPLPTPELPTSSEFIIIRVKGGFRIIRNKNRCITSGNITISSAYALRRGDPFSKYSPFDFEMNKSPIKVRVKNVKVLGFKRNLILAQVLDPAFAIEVVGFDPHRDLVVKVEKVSRDIA